MELLAKHASVDPITGVVSFNGLYGNLCVNIGFKNEIVVVPYSHIVWFLTHSNEWPQSGMHVDHINDNAFDNRPANLQELTEEDNQKKRRGRKIYRSYGTGKYGFGIGVTHDKRDDRYYVSRHLSRGHGNGELKTIRASLGGFDTQREAEQFVAKCVEEIKQQGLDYMPAALPQRPKRMTTKLDRATHKLRRMRKAGRTIQEIAELTGFSAGSIYKRVRDINIDLRISDKELD